MSVVPPAFAFRFSMPVPRNEAIPKRGRRLLDLDDTHRLLWPGHSLDQESSVSMKAGWNAMGIGFQFEVQGKEHLPVSNPDHATETDGIQIWIDTRNTQTIHRANRFCHHFCVLPNGAGKSGTNSLVKQVSVNRAIEDAPISRSQSIQSKSQLIDGGYRLDVWLEASQLNGFDPEISPRLGLFVMLYDSEIGNRTLTVDEAFPFPSDPSVWQTIELLDA